MEKEYYPFDNLPKLETERLLLRKVAYTDRSDIYTYAHLPEVAQFVKFEPHTSDFESLEFINIVMEMYNKRKPAPWAIEFKEDKKMIGTIGFHNWNMEHFSAELGFVLSPLYWNMGITTEALKRIIKFVFEETNINRIEAKCEPENSASSRVMEKAGFTYEGTLRDELRIKGKFRDYRHYSILRREYLGKDD